MSSRHLASNVRRLNFGRMAKTTEAHQTKAHSWRLPRYRYQSGTCICVANLPTIFPLDLFQPKPQMTAPLHLETGALDLAPRP
jgi:hypothetical protein